MNAMCDSKNQLDNVAICPENERMKKITLADIIISGTRLKLHRFGSATVVKVAQDRITNELVAQVKSDEHRASMYLSLAYCAKVLA